MSEGFELADASELQAWIDRLVDGELADDQRRNLLLALDARPDAWRRCALSFVESQVLRSDLSCFSERSALPSSAAKFVNVRASRKAWSRWLALAASLLVAFLLGTALEGFSRGDRTPIPREVATSGQSGTPSNPAKWETLKVAVPAEDGGDRMIEVPLYEGDAASVRSLLANQKPVLSDLAIEALKETGHEVQQRRTFYPIQLQDGRQAVLPMDYVEVKNTAQWQ